MELKAAPEREAPLCEWIESGLRQIAGQDPLGLQTITTDRILPALLPGILALSVRARYFSIYPFLVRRYQERAGTASNEALDDFIREREFELCVAFNLCDRCDADSAIGNQKVRSLVASHPAQYERTRSIKTRLGGYGLYYRGPLEELGMIIPAGAATLGEETTPIDIIARSERAAEVADAFESAIANTRWYRDWMHGVDPIPAEVLEELGQAACLCRLDEHRDERQAIRDLLTTASSEGREEASEQRRRALALLLALIDRDPEVAYDTGALREELIETFLAEPSGKGPAAEVRAAWAAMAMRECLQDALSSVWVHFCRAGLACQPFEGMTRGDLTELVRTELIGEGEITIDEVRIQSDPDEPAKSWLGNIRDAAGSLGWEELRGTAVEADDALSGLAILTTLVERVPDPGAVSSAWTRVGAEDGEHQRGLLGTAALVRSELAHEPTVQDLMSWLLNTLVIPVHETVAMGKLPESTFRFWREEGRLRFVDNGVWRFEPSGLRRGALSSISADIGWWEWDEDDTPVLTP